MSNKYTEDWYSLDPPPKKSSDMKGVLLTSLLISCILGLVMGMILGYYEGVRDTIDWYASTGTCYALPMR